MSAGKRNLVIGAVGDGSVHRSWLDPQVEPTYDLLLIYYGDMSGFAACDAKLYLQRKGMKWELIGHALDTLSGEIARYANFWCPDDDIRATPGQINLLFALFEQYRLQMAQPAIATGELSFQVT